MSANPPQVVIEISSSSDEEEEDDAILLIGSSFSQKRTTEDSDVVLIAKVLCPDGRVMDKSTAGLKKTEDEDCCVLDGDPNKKALSLDFKPSDADDDLVVVGESGPVACRDYPHARHLCVKFPFKTTSHESHCGQCHCYVCDVLAPCLLWSEGGLGGDHCHACDKDEKWKRLRSLVRTPPSKNWYFQPTPVHDTPRIQPGRPQQRSQIMQSQPRVHVRPQPRGDMRYQSRSHVQVQQLRTFVQPIGETTAVLATSAGSTHLSPSHLPGFLRPFAVNATRAHPRFLQSQDPLPPTVPRIAPAVMMSVPPPGVPPNGTPVAFANIASYQAPKDAFAHRDVRQLPNLQLYTGDGAYLRSQETSSYSSTSEMELGAVPPRMGQLQPPNPFSNLQNDLQTLRDCLRIGILEQREQPMAKDGYCSSSVTTNGIAPISCMDTISSDGGVQNQPAPAMSRRQSAEVASLVVPAYIGSASGLTMPKTNIAEAQQASSESSAQELLNFLNDGVDSPPLDYSFSELDCNSFPVLDCTDFYFEH